MQGWLRDYGGLLLAWACIQILVVTMVGGPSPRQRRLGHAVVRLVRPAPDAEVFPLRRPVEQIGADVRRLHEAFHREGMRFAKYEGCRLAYDGVLTEAADMLELDHLMTLLPPGAELDHERERLEHLLGEAGMLPRPRAA